MSMTIGYACSAGIHRLFENLVKPSDVPKGKKMKRSLLLAAILAVGLMACKKEEKVVTPPPAPAPTPPVAAPAPTPAPAEAPKADTTTGTSTTGTGTTSSTTTGTGTSSSSSSTSPMAPTTPMPSSVSESKPTEKK